MHTGECELCDRVARLDSVGLCPRCAARSAAFAADVRPLPSEYRWEPVDGLRNALLATCPGLAAGFGGGR